MNHLAFAMPPFYMPTIAMKENRLVFAQSFPIEKNTESINILIGEAFDLADGSCLEQGFLSVAGTDNDGGEFDLRQNKH